jgi:hypothetical protein
MLGQILLAQFGFAAVAAGGCYQTYSLFRDQPLKGASKGQAGLMLGLGAVTGALTLGAAVMAYKIPDIMTAAVV